MKSFIEFLTEEMPYLYPYRKPLEKLSYIPMSSLRNGFTCIGDIDTFNFKVYENDETGSVQAGLVVHDRFYVAIRISCEERNLFIRSMQLSDKRKHIKLVNTDKDLSRQTIAVSVYTFLAKRYDLISDRIQFLGAKDLWESLARRNDVNVYVFDENRKDYIRKDGNIVKYNSQNIDDNVIWGIEDQQNRLLVATIRELK